MKKNKTNNPKNIKKKTNNKVNMNKEVKEESNKPVDNKKKFNIKEILSNKKKRIIFFALLLVIIISIVLLIYALVNITNWNKDVSSNNEIKEDIINNYVEKKENEETKEEEFKVNFKDLNEVNSDTFGYITVNNTKINYVVVKTNNDSYYLNHDFNKKYNIAGWIFADMDNNKNTVDRNIVLYGHNMMDGSMFAGLKETLKADWQNNKDNELITYITEVGTYKYQVFSTYTIIPEDYYITTSFSSDKDYSTFLSTIKSRSNHNYNVSVSASDKILTLSSCTDDGNRRIVLHAKLVSVENNS